MKKVFGGLDNVQQVRRGLRLVKDDGSADRIEVTVVIVVEGLAVHVALQNAGCIVCRPTEGGSSGLNGLLVYVEE